MKFLFTNLLQEGGPLFMYTTLICLIICLVLITKSFTKGDVEGKSKQLIKHISLFALVWGFLGFMTGMIGAMDVISIADDIATPVLAGGLKIAMLSPTFGIITFLIVRLGLIGLTLKK